MGDVAMLIPTLYAVAEANPNDSFTFLTQPFLTKLLIAPPSNLHVKAIDIKGEQKRFWDVLDYAKQLYFENFDAVIDLHCVLRSRMISYIVAARYERRQYSIRKPRKARKAFLNAPQGNRKPVPRMLDVYAKAFRKAGLTVPEEIKPLSIESREVQGDSFPAYQAKYVKNIKRIGIAPFASTASKTYDEEQMQAVIRELSEDGAYYIYLFGGKGEEESKLKEWAEPYDNVQCLVGSLSLMEELQLIAQLDCMLSMDSANAHLAAMFGTRVVSVWCTTHPLGGFMSLGQQLSDCLTPDESLYPPCSIFGQIKDKSIDVAAYQKAIPVKRITSHIKQILA